jgi:imidazolonepropionase-like amidohydrolase
VISGYSVHEELVLLVSAGLTPLEALRTATLNPARALGREADLGTVAKGKLADLVLLDADPLADIGATSQIRAVVLNGRLFTRAQLDQLLASAETAAQAH